MKLKILCSVLCLNSSLYGDVTVISSCNHFSVEILKKLLFWDAYNVTEDADLGLRLAQMGYKTRIIDSETLEESPTAF